MKEEIGAAVSSFASAGGGTILIGVTDAGAMKGLDVGKKTTTDLAEKGILKREGGGRSVKYLINVG